MSEQVLDQLKQQASSLSKQEKFILAKYLLEQAREPDEEKDIRERQLEWLKTNRDKYAGQYIALDGDILVSQGETLREVRRQAEKKGVKDAFIVKVFSEDTILSAGL